MRHGDRAAEVAAGKPPSARPATQLADADASVWWQSVHQLIDRPVRDLLDGFDEIAAAAIPYDWLPGRARTFYGPDFATWSDLGPETIYSLVNRPKGGIGTVRAILTAGWEAVRNRRALDIASSDAPSAVGRLLDRLTAYDRAALAGCSWALQPMTRAAMAELLGVHPINLQRNYPRAAARFQGLLADPSHAAVRRHAAELRYRLGPLTQMSSAEAALADLDLALSDDTATMLLHLAGPYTPADHTWLEDASAGGLQSAETALETAFTQWGAPTTAVLAEALAELGIPYPTAVEFVASRPGLRRFDQKWVRWGTTMLDKVEAALHLSGAPATGSLIAALIGEDCSESAVRHALSYDSRFVRTTRQTWALKQWGLSEYTGLFGEIATRIDAAGGIVGTGAVIADICKMFPDVSETSVRSYLGAPAFVVDKQKVRRRTDADGWPPVGPAASVRGVFHKGRHEIRVALPVTVDHVRGSGQPLHPAVATALGLTPGSERLFIGAASINAYWRTSSITGGNVGSLRAVAAGVGAELGDTLVLSFNVSDSTVAAVRVPSDAGPRQRMKGLVGRLGAVPRLDVARALRCHPNEVDALLRKRGDEAVLVLLDDIGP
ncbi:hypothetical protein [Mycolicibacterium frederiksbergense]|uniref:hypothetical protein n=1 Tax=Mycolicibacterium frederiksbergense TaxID=117567 RepID=UPI001F2FF7C0|nr:hypothetical protein [Mycolicibacterium frederiksbergense]